MMRGVVEYSERAARSGVDPVVVAAALSFDATRHAEFLYQCVERTVGTDLPSEVDYLE